MHKNDKKPTLLDVMNEFKKDERSDKVDCYATALSDFYNSKYGTLSVVNSK